jgi:hypothetical protein
MQVLVIILLAKTVLEKMKLEEKVKELEEKLQEKSREE